jgi:hypothetical protein
VSTPMTASTWPSSMGMAVAPSRRRPWLAPAWVGVTTWRQDCEGSRPRADRLLHQASDDGGPGRCRQLEDRSAARHATRRPARTGVTLPAGASLPAPRPGTISSITVRTTASARSTRSSAERAGVPALRRPPRQLAATLGGRAAALVRWRPVALAGLDPVAAAVRGLQKPRRATGSRQWAGRPHPG